MAAPITLQDIVDHLGTTRPDPGLGDLIKATVSLVEGWKGKPIAEWPDSWRLGTIMLIARFDRRRNSPAGVDTVTEMGPVYVSRRDPDVAQLLELGAWRRPVVG